MVFIYDRWYPVYSSQILNLEAAIERLGINQGKVFEVLDTNLDMLSDMRYVYTESDTLQKREFVNIVFNKNLYYQNGIYRTPTMIDMLSHNASKMEEKGYLIYQKKRDAFSSIPQSGLSGTTIEHLIPILTFFENLK